MAKVFISLGSNIDKEQNVECGLMSLKQLLGDITISSIYQCEAVGFDGPEFYNLVISAETNIELVELADRLRTIEYQHGREQNAKKYSPRTLDLDILLYDNVISEQPVQLPRHEITFNAFVLWPLAEIAGDLLHPILQKSYAEIWHEFDKTSQKITKIKWCL